MSDELPVKLTPEAELDLKRMGRFTRRLVKQALTDELRTPLPSLVDPKVAHRGWKVLPIGSYRVLYKSVDSDGEATRLVGHIKHKEEIAADAAADAPGVNEQVSL